jgi:hypothetical protein
MHVTLVIHQLTLVQGNHRHQNLLQSVRGQGRALPFELEEVVEVQTVEHLDKDRELDGSRVRDLH